MKGLVKRGKLNILFVSEFYHPRIGGGENWTKEMAEELCRRGHTVHVVTSRLPNTALEERLNGVRIHRPFASGSIIQRFRLRRQLRTYLLAFIKEHHIAIIHSNAYIPTTPAAAAGRNAGIPVVSSVHLNVGSAWFRIVNPLFALINWYGERAIVKHAQHSVVHVTAQATKRNFQGITKAPIMVIYNFMDDKPVRKAYRSTNTAAIRKKYGVKGTFILYVGSLLKLKNIEETIRQVNRSEGEMTFLIGGTGPHEKALRRYVERNISPGKTVKFIGKVDEEEKFRLMASCDAFVLLSKSEQFPLTILEAIALDRDVIATRVGGVPDVAAAKVTKRLHIIEPDEFPATIAKIPATQGKRINEKVFKVYNKERIVSEFEKLYRQLLQR